MRNENLLFTIFRGPCNLICELIFLNAEETLQQKKGEINQRMSLNERDHSKQEREKFVGGKDGSLTRE